MAFRSITPNINVNTESGQLRTELSNTFARLDGDLQYAPYRLDFDIGPVANTAGTETTLFSTSVPINTLSKTGSSLLIFTCGKTAANANVKTINVYFGSTVLFTTGAVAMNNADWTMQIEIVRTGASNQTAWVQFFSNNTLTQSIKVTTATESLAVNQTFRVTGNGAGAADVSGYYSKVILLT